MPKHPYRPVLPLAELQRRNEQSKAAAAARRNQPKPTTGTPKKG